MFIRIKKSIIEKRSIIKMKRWTYRNRPLTSTELRRRRELANSEGFLKWLNEQDNDNKNGNKT